MKVNILFLVFILFFAGCGSDDEIKLESYNAEAFAYDLGESWEVNATTRVKGYLQTEENNMFNATLTYDIDLVTPSGDTLKSLISRTEDFEENEKMIDTALETQFELDSTYQPGKYFVIFNVKDAGTSQSAVTSVDFTLTDDD